MKKTVINFQNPLYIVCFFTLFLLTACQKENIQPIFENNVKDAIDRTIETHELDLSDLVTQMNINARADSWVVANEIVQVTNEGPYLMAINVEDLPNPNTHRLDVTIIPFDKPTDLMLQSFDPERNPTHLDIKESQNPGMNTDFIKFRQNDFVAGETNAVIKIEWEGFGNKFEIKINAVPVDCEEDQPRSQGDVGIDFQPVCGCDGRTYFDETAAYNAGITAYQRGRCIPNLNIPVDGVWESLDINWPQHYVIIEDDCIEYIILDDTNITIKICDDEEETKEEGRTWTVIDKSKKSFLIWPVEKWSAQVNGQGELEIYKTNAAAKAEEKEDGPKTILHRYKRIK